MWIWPLFTSIPLNLLLIPKISKLGFIFDTRSCEIDDLAVSSRQCYYKFYEFSPLVCHSTKVHVYALFKVNYVLYGCLIFYKVK